jgi:hypothetical protein
MTAAGPTNVAGVWIPALLAFSATNGLQASEGDEAFRLPSGRQQGGADEILTRPRGDAFRTSVRRRSPITICAERVRVTALELLRHSEPTHPLGAVSFSMRSRACRLALLRRPTLWANAISAISRSKFVSSPAQSRKLDRHPCVVIAG